MADNDKTIRLLEAALIVAKMPPDLDRDGLEKYVMAHLGGHKFWEVDKANEIFEIATELAERKG